MTGVQTCALPISNVSRGRGGSDAAGDLQLKSGLGLDIQSTGTLNVNSGATTLGGTLGVTNDATFSADIHVNGGDITTNQTSARLFNTGVTDLDIGGQSTSLTIGATSGTLNIRNSTVNIDGDLEVDGGEGEIGRAHV